MPRSSEVFVLPVGPSELCFDKNEFMKKTFSVDDFLHEHRNVASLEVMRDDLGLYLKVLRSAMIELINEDYGDFVNLSANLMGLDEFMTSIQKPLQRLEEDILNIKVILDDNIDEIRRNLENKKLLRSSKGNLRSLTKVHKSTSKLIELLGHLDDGLNPVLLERASLELIKLNFSSQFCSIFLEESQILCIKKLHQELLDKLKVYFLNALNQGTDSLERSLRIYGTLDECSTAEEVFRNEIVSSYMNKVISETALQNSPQGLTSIYNQILNFIPLHMKDILLLTHHGGKVKGFNFLINSFWKIVQDRIKTNMTSIFAPGNPDSFYMKYKATHDFLSKIKSTLNDEQLIKSFESNEQFKSFQARWNLPVYFQIRFQEIAGTFESICNQSLNDVTTNASCGDKNPIRMAYANISKCWESGVYIDRLFPRFWKLTLQIISRTSRWISEFLKAIRIKNGNFDKIVAYISLYCDAIDFKKQLSSVLVLARDNLPNELKAHSAILEKCMDDASCEVDNQIVAIENLLTEEIISKSLIYIRQVNDIPRLYRKTNRDIPNKHCSYIEQMMEPMISFRNNNEKINDEKTREILVKAFSSITTKYYTAVEDVLTSVQKTEESLRRLKNLREKTTTSLSAPSDRSTLSDDDKIRLQLQVDAIYWVESVEKFQIQRTDVQKLTDLISLVEDVTRIKIRNK